MHPNGEYIAPPHLHLRETDSTQSAMREMLDMQPLEYTYITADYQLAGCGQHGTHWESERGCNLLMSTVLYPDSVPVAKQFTIAMGVAIAIVKTLRQLAPKHDFTIKWPNDIYHGDKKICGTIIENILTTDHSIRASIVGIGINLNQSAFTTTDNACSLIQLTGIPTRMDAASALLIHNLRKRQPALHEEYMSLLYRNDGEYHAYSDRDGNFEARIEDIATDGGITLARKDGTTAKYYIKEVVFI